MPSKVILTTFGLIQTTTAKQEPRIYSHIRNIPGSPHIAWVDDSSADEDAFALGHSHDLPRGSPPVALDARPSVCATCAGVFRRTVDAERASVIDLEHGAVFDGGPHQGVFGIEWQTWMGQWKSDDVGGVCRGHAMIETRLGERCCGRRGQGNQIVWRQQRRICVRLESRLQ